MAVRKDSQRKRPNAEPTSPTPPETAAPERPDDQSLEQLEREFTELAAHIQAATEALDRRARTGTGAAGGEEGSTPSRTSPRRRAGTPAASPALN